MRAKFGFGLIFGLLLVFASLQQVLADGIIIPSPCPMGNCLPPDPLHPMAQLAIRYHHVTVKIDQQMAITHVDQVFINPNDYAVEGTYIFPLPLNAVVSNFILWVDGKPVEGKVLDAAAARERYEEIVRSLRDPALLEYIGKGAFQASIFPIPPGGERRIELEYQQVLTAENGLVRYVYPLNTEKFSVMPLESVSVTVEISSNQPVRAVYSPSHNVHVTHTDDNHGVASYEDSNVTPDTDFALYYSLGESEAFHLFSYRDPSDPAGADGFFLLLLAPGIKDADVPVNKDLLLVLDRSGSMEGEKFQQAQSAARYILAHLNEGDRFYLASFSDDYSAFSNRLVPAGQADKASDWVNGLSASGSTDLNRALLKSASVVDTERPTYLIFLTDGLPTAGEIDTDKILTNFSASAPKNLRLFSFGVGYDVDTTLLDSLSQENHGTSSYVQPGQALDEVLSGFYARISTPVLTDLEIEYGGLSVFDVFPSPLPDLFKGDQVVIVGRYREGGSFDLTLKGNANNTPQSFQFPGQSFSRDSRSEIGEWTGLPRLWAARKIGHLLNQIRLNGADQETIDQIVKLSIRYGIVTPYTSYLVEEAPVLGGGAQGDLSHDIYGNLISQPTAASSGAGAVQRSAKEGDLKGAVVPPSAGEEAQGLVRIIGTRTFLLMDGVWVDTSYDPQTMTLQTLEFLSPDYFKLMESRPDLAAALAAGEKVILVVDGMAYQVAEEGTPGNVTTLPPALTPAVTRTPYTTVSTPVDTPTPVNSSTPLAGGADASGQGSLPGGIIAGGAVFLVMVMAVWVRQRK